MLIRRLYVYLILVPGLFFSSCADAPRNYNSGILGIDQINLIQTDSFTGNFNQKSTSFKTVIATGGSDILLLGTYGNQAASFLMQFSFPLADSIKTDLLSDALTIDDGWVELTKNYVFGDTLGSFNYAVYKINSSWTSIGFTSDSLNGSFLHDATDLSFNKSAFDSVTTFHIDKTYLTSEMKDYSNDIPVNGVYVVPTSGTGTVFGFGAKITNSVTQPIIRVVVTKAGVYTDTLSFELGADVSVLKGNLPTADPDEIVLQSSLVGQATLAFDVSALPSNALITKANLILTSDTLKSVRGNSVSPSLVIFNIQDSSARLIDSTLNAVSLTLTGSGYAGLITPFVQKWLFTKQNQGIILAPGDGLRGMEIFVFRGSTYTDKAKRPRLEITYTLKN